MICLHNPNLRVPPTLDPNARIKRQYTRASRQAFREFWHSLPLEGKLDIQEGIGLRQAVMLFEIGFMRGVDHEAQESTKVVA